MAVAVLLLGGNLGPVTDTFSLAVEQLQGAGTVRTKSAIYQSAPWGFNAESDFLNQVVILDTSLCPEVLLEFVLGVEKDLGRERRQAEHYESRMIDIDLLFYDDQVIHTERLQVPHPRLHLRNFCLVPLAEVIPDFIHPILHETIHTLLQKSPDSSQVTIFEQ